jgi:arginine/lysine/ornithine decarboxylase
MTTGEQGTVGASFEDFLREQGTLEATTEQAVKRVVAFQLAQAMKAQGIGKTAMAARLSTSRSQLDRLLDPDGHAGVSLALLARAAAAVGRRLQIDLV